jgi:hypothetical protein
MAKRGMAFFGLLAAMATTIVGAAPAQATPSGCSYYTTSKSASGYCSSGTGVFRIYTTCDIPLAPDVKKYGDWYRAGYGTSSGAYCPSNTRSVHNTGWNFA